jgi:hypothetical protein
MLGPLRQWGGHSSECYPARVTPLARRRRVDPLLLVVGFVTLLLLGLGCLQYRWTGELSEAEGVRLRAGLKMRADLLAQDLDREVTRAFLRLQVDSTTLRATVSRALNVEDTSRDDG